MSTWLILIVKPVSPNGTEAHAWPMKPSVISNGKSSRWVFTAWWKIQTKIISICGICAFWFTLLESGYVFQFPKQDKSTVNLGSISRYNLSHDFCPISQAITVCFVVCCLQMRSQAVQKNKKKSCCNLNLLGHHKITQPSFWKWPTAGKKRQQQISTFDIS